MEDEEIEWYISEENREDEVEFYGRGFNDEAKEFMNNICTKCLIPPDGRNLGYCWYCNSNKKYRKRKEAEFVERDIVWEWKRCGQCNRCKDVHKWSNQCKDCYNEKWRKEKKNIKRNNFQRF